jgi:aspartyl-tRNA(Asn)/glutamyl-tRNA(Gln) amidotransferase subunit A
LSSSSPFSSSLSFLYPVSAFSHGLLCVSRRPLRLCVVFFFVFFFLSHCVLFVPSVVNSSPMTASDLAFASIETLASLYRKRRVSPVEVTQLLLSRIESFNPKLNAYLTVTADLALAQAKKAESELFKKSRRDRGPLHGIPISLKDNIYTKDVRTTAGSRILKDFIPLHDAPVVSQLKDAGAVILGKTNMHEFAYGVTSNNPHYGPVRNPWNLACIAGGSSGGSAAAVAAGLCCASIGTDTGGSIRIPAALCGVVGLKPGVGRVNPQDTIPLSPTLDFVGPIARSVRDAALMLDPIFSRARGEKSPMPSKSSSRRRFRLGIPSEFFFNANNLDVQSAFQDAVRSIQKKLATLVEVSLPMLEETEDAGNQIAWPEATRYHQHSGWFPRFSDQYGEDVRSRLEAGTKVSAVAYLDALHSRARFIQQFHAAITEAKVDALIVPTTPIAAPKIGQEKVLIGGKEFSTRALLLRHNRPANLAGVPAISLPCGFTPAGLPIGLQLIGAVASEPLLLTIACALEGILSISSHPPFASA